MPNDNPNAIYRLNDFVLPKPFVVCGVELKPFCLGHYIFLSELKNHFVLTNESETTLDSVALDLFRSVSICGLSYEDGKEMMENPEVFEQRYTAFTDFFFNQYLPSKKQPAKNADGTPIIDKDGNTVYIETFNIWLEKAEFEKYMEYWLDIPLFDETASERKEPSGIDWTLSLANVLTKLNYDENKIMNMSFRQLYYVWAAEAESSGNIKVWPRWRVEPFKEREKQKKLNLIKERLGIK